MQKERVPNPTRVMPPKSRKNRSQPTVRERLARLDAEKKALTRRLAVLKQKTQRKKKRDDIFAMSLSDSFKWILLLLYVFGGYSVDIAQAYWVRKRSRKKLPPLEPVDTKAYIEELYLAKMIVRYGSALRATHPRTNLRESKRMSGIPNAN